MFFGGFQAMNLAPAFRSVSNELANRVNAPAGQQTQQVASPSGGTPFHQMAAQLNQQYNPAIGSPLEMQHLQSYIGSNPAYNAQNARYGNVSGPSSGIYGLFARNLSKLPMAQGSYNAPNAYTQSSYGAPTQSQLTGFAGSVPYMPYGRFF